jgi:hypothetical protein
LLFFFSAIFLANDVLANTEDIITQIINRGEVSKDTPDGAHETIRAGMLGTTRGHFASKLASKD